MKHEIDVKIRTPKEEKNGAFLYALVTVDDFIRFQVRGQTYADRKTVEVKSFYAYPSQKRGEDWQNVVLVDEELRKEIQEAIGEKIKDTYLKSSFDYLEKITKVSVNPINQEKELEDRIIVRAMADVEISGLTVKGIALKESKKGYFINMPQYLDGTGAYADLAYGITADAQQALKEAVLNEYQRVLEQGKQQNEDTRKKQLEMQEEEPVQETQEKQFQDLSRALQSLIEDGWETDGNFCVLPREEYPESTLTLLQDECEREDLKEFIQFEADDICLDMAGLAERYHFKLSSERLEAPEALREAERGERAEKEVAPRI